MIYKVQKTFDHSFGLSCVFRQWRATSHCRFLHGYAIKVILTFESESLDERNWVTDFGGFDFVKTLLKFYFDHTLIVAEDDPMAKELAQLEKLGLAKVRILPAVGCEKFSEFIFEKVKEMKGMENLCSVEVQEHLSNSASYGK